MVECFFSHQAVTFKGVYEYIQVDKIIKQGIVTHESSQGILSLKFGWNKFVGEQKFKSCFALSLATGKQSE